MPILDYTVPRSQQPNLPNPPGFIEPGAALSKKRAADSSSNAAAAAAAADSYAKLKQKRAWDLAISPAKSLPMNAFMLYMSGNTVQIFSIGILAMLLLNPIKAVSTIHTTFAPFTPSKSNAEGLVLPKLAYIACNILTLCLGLYKCRQMGLIPVGTGDWLAFETRGNPPEISLY